MSLCITKISGGINVAQQLLCLICRANSFGIELRSTFSRFKKKFLFVI